MSRDETEAMTSTGTGPGTSTGTGPETGPGTGPGTSPAAWAGESAARLGLCSCHVCALVCRRGPLSAAAHCPRCGAALHFRKPGSVGACWSLVVAAIILYIPANLLIIMETGSLISYRKDTILSGCIHLWKTGSYFVAVVVFVASIMIPILKLISLCYLLITVQRRSTWQPRQRTRLYRLLELVGRWSMLDVYVVTLLAALVQLGNLAVVKAGPGAVAFGAVVVLTMFASRKFDPRFIWDPVQKGRSS